MMYGSDSSAFTNPAAACVETALSTFEQLPCDGCGFRGSACTYKAKPPASDATPDKPIPIPSREEVLKSLQDTFDKVMAEQDRCKQERDALNARLSWLATYETTLRNAIYALDVEEKHP
jgi:hypothetical protein